MKYWQPFDQPGTPDAGYVNGNPSAGTPGSIPPAGVFEQPQREIVNFISDCGIAPLDTDLHQLGRGVQTGKVIFGVDTGTANAMVVALTPVPLLRTVGMTVRVKKGPTPNSAAATLNIGLGDDPVKRSGGADTQANDIPANSVCDYGWDGSAWQMVNFQGFNATSTTQNNFTLTIPYCADTSGVANTVTAPFAPAITSLAAGDMIRIKLANTVTGVTMVTVNAMAPIEMVSSDGSSMRSGDAVVGQIMILEYDGSKLQLINKSSAANFVPGGIYLWPLATPPTGCLECNGAMLSTSTYARLFGILGYTYGGGGANFKLPDYRGEFLRGWDHGRGVDPDASTRVDRGDGTGGDAVGSRQSGSVGNFSAVGTIELGEPTFIASDVAKNPAVVPQPSRDYPLAADIGPFYLLAGLATHSESVLGWAGVTGTLFTGDEGLGVVHTGFGGGGTGRGMYISKINGVGSFTGGGGAETRPRNVNIMYVIAY